MATFNLDNAKMEIVNMLRNADVISTTIRGVTTATHNATASTGQTTITLSNTPVRNIRSFTINSVTFSFIRDYALNSTTGVVTLNSALSSSFNNTAIVISYDYGSSDKIYPDFPRDQMNLSSYPRVGIDITTGSSEPFDLGVTSDISEFMLTVFAIVPSNQVSGIAGGLGGTSDLDTLIRSIRNAFRGNKKSFYSFPLILPNAGPNPITYGKDNKTMMRSQDFRLPFVVETN